MYPSVSESPSKTISPGDPPPDGLIGGAEERSAG